MTSDPDDNPFARNSMWPKMPQAPMQVRGVGRLHEPSVAPGGPEAPSQEEAPEPVPQRLTPAFVRPLEGSAPSLGGLTPVAVKPLNGPAVQPGARPVPGTITPLVVRPTVQLSPPESASAPAVTPAARPQTPLVPRAVEPETSARIEPQPPHADAAENPAAFVAPLKRGAARGKGRSRRAGLLFAGGAAAVLAVAVGVTLAGRQDTAPTPVSSPVVATPDPVAVETQTEVSAPTPVPAAEAPDEVAAPVQGNRRVARLAPAAGAPQTSIVLETPPARAAVAEATEDVMSAPVLSLPPPAPAADPLPAYTPPAAPDPEAPMTTTRRY